MVENQQEDENKRHMLTILRNNNYHYIALGKTGSVVFSSGITCSTYQIIETVYLLEVLI